ncbi:MAG: hypothetical protein AB7S38_40780 [Vulcanimicrobiota bacterium]
MLIRSLHRPAPAVPKAPAKPQPSYGREDRISYFVQQLGAEAVTQVRHLSAAYAGQMIATTAGVLALAPLAESLGQIHVLTIGGTLAAGIGAVAGYYLERSRGLKPVTPGLDGVGQAAATLRSLPDFVYPTIVNATAAETELINSTLDTLPMGDVTSVSTMTVMPDMGPMGISGVAPPGLSQNLVYFDRKHLGYSWFNRELVTHELAHGKDLSAGYGPIGTHSIRGGGFGRAPFVSHYAGTNFLEDYAESYVEFHQHPDRLRELAPRKYAALEAADPKGVEEWLTDRPQVRDLGKQVAETIGQVPYARNALELAGALIAPWQMHRGATQIESGQRLAGKLNLASGFFLASGASAPLVLGVSAIGLAQNERLADITLAGSLGPLGMMGLAVTDQLTSEGVDLSQQFQGVKLDGERNLGALWLALTASGVGGVVGAVAGAHFGGVAGALSGSALGSLTGGALGMGAYVVDKVRHGAPATGPLALTREDKWHLAKLAGGGLVGGVAGGLAGHWVGQAVGSALGSLAGPLGAEVGGSVGGWAGTLAAAYGGARLGSKISSAIGPAE